MSLCTIPMVAANTAVIMPMMATTRSAVGVKKGYMRPTMKTPAATMVAAWIRAETGVGPAMASGSHTWSGNWADLEIAPQKTRMPAAVSMAWLEVAAHCPLFTNSKISWKLKVPVTW